MRPTIVIAILGAWAACFTAIPSAEAQEAEALPTAIPVWDAVSRDAVSVRRPGRVVQAGIGRFQDAHDAAIAHAQNGPEITEVEPPVDAGSALRAALITEIFSGLDSAIQLLASVIGLPIDESPGEDPDSTDLTDLLGTITDSSE